jgi:hypothetical protein
MTNLDSCFSEKMYRDSVRTEGRRGGGCDGVGDCGEWGWEVGREGTETKADGAWVRFER